MQSKHKALISHILTNLVRLLVFLNLKYVIITHTQEKALLKKMPWLVEFYNMSFGMWNENKESNSQLMWK